MSSPNSRRLLARLRQDLAELQDDPYPGVDVFSDDANLRKLCLILTPSSGPFTGLALHFDVNLPDDWPSSPPSVSSSVRDVDHPNLFGSYICCDLLKPTDLLGRRGYSGGYSPAFTLRGLFLQFLSFFSSRSVEQDYGRPILIGEYNEEICLWEEDLQSHLGGHKLSSVYCCPCRDGHLQEEYAKIWEKDSGKENFVRHFHDINGHRVIHNSKYITDKFMSLHKITGVNPRWLSTSTKISEWSCTKCPYGSSLLPHIQGTKVEQIEQPNANTVVPFMKPSSSCSLLILNDDILGELSLYLSSESIISLSEAYPRFRAVVAFFHVLLRKELNCFFLRSPLNESILGIGVSLDPGSRRLLSDFDWLSMEAFDCFSIRSSIRKKSFQYFLPLAFSRVHFKKSETEIWSRLGKIDLAVCKAEELITVKSKRPTNRRVTPPLKPHQTVEVLYRMMNNIVVSLMESCDRTMEGVDVSSRAKLLYNSEKAIISYCHLFHLLIRLSGTTPAILNDATWKLRNFVTKPEIRLKDRTPDLGELIIMMTLVLVLPPIDQQTPMSWDTLCGKFLQEAMTRNVRWVLKESPELEVLEDGLSEYRLFTTFDKSKTSLRLMMFQITFLDMFMRTYSSHISNLDDNYGFAEDGLPERMVAEIKDIYGVNTWAKFFAYIKYSQGLKFSKEAFCDMLRMTVRESVARQYHVGAGEAKLKRLKTTRNKMEGQFKPR